MIFGKKIALQFITKLVSQKSLTAQGETKQN
jgi:hypothetical protein